MAEVLTLAVKAAVRRTRPEGAGFSFPSGHATITFASATVLQQHFGWKVGVPAYAVAALFFAGISSMLSGGSESVEARMARYAGVDARRFG